MFSEVTEEQYLKVVEYADTIHKSEITRNVTVVSPYYSLEHQRLRTEAAFNKNKNHFETKDEIILFKLNLLINNNDLFNEILLDNCSRILGETDLKKITRSFKLRSIVMTDEWEEIINTIGKMFSVKAATIIAKIAEMLTFANVYSKAQEENKNPIKSLSLR